MINLIFSLLIISSIAIFITVYVFNYKPNRKDKVKDLYAEGLDLLVSGKRKAAYQNFKEIISKDSNNIKAYLRLGQVLRESNNPKQALKIHQRLLHRKKLNFHDKIDLHKNMVLDYFFDDNYLKAVKELEIIIKMDKLNEWAIGYLVKVHCKIQDWYNASHYLQKHQKITNTVDNHKLALYKIQEGRILIRKEMFSEARKKFEDALMICNDLAAAYYFMGNSFSAESEVAYQNSLEEKKNVNLEDDDVINNALDDASILLEKAIPMWIRYVDLKPKQAWMVIYLLKDALFALDRYSEFENILKQIIKNDKNNIEVIASLSEILSHRGEEVEALEFIESAIDQAPSSLLVKLMKLKHEAKKEKGSSEYMRSLDDIIHFLVRDERFQIYKDTNTDPDILWLYETSADDVSIEV